MSEPRFTLKPTTPTRALPALPARPRRRSVVSHVLGCGLVCLLCQLAAGAAVAAESAEGPLDGTPPERIVAFGDVHGDAEALNALLEALGLTGPDGTWTGGRTRLVSLGDLLDRGPDSRVVMDLLMSLEDRAAAAGGSVHVVLGNHEIMNLTGDLRYVSAGEYAAFAAEEDPAVRARERQRFIARETAKAEEAVVREADSGVQSADRGPEDPAVRFDRTFPPGYFAHRAAFAPDGRYGRWLLSKPQILELDGIAFVHGGLSAAFVDLPLAEFVARADTTLRALLTLGDRLVANGILEPWQDLLTAHASAPDTALPADLVELRRALAFAPDGPSWYRGTAACHPMLEQPRFEAVLAARKLRRVVMGHTPTFPRVIQTRFDGRAVLADTGMYAEYYHGRPTAAVFGDGEPRYLRLSDTGALTAVSGRPLVDVRAAGSPALLAELDDALSRMAAPEDEQPLVVKAGGRRQLAWFREENARQSRHRLAAQALDHLLGLGLVAPVLRPEASRGAFEVMPAAAFSEAERAASARYRPNWCSAGSDYDLMVVLDALMGIDIRGADTLYYDPATWLIYLTGHADAFPTWRRLPLYLNERDVALPPLLADRLANLSADALEEALGSHLSERQRRAVLARRDLILANWPVTES